MQNTTTHDTRITDTKMQETVPRKIRVRHECAPVHGGTERDLPRDKTRESVNTRVAQDRVPEGPSKSRGRCESPVLACPEITCPPLTLHPAHTFFFVPRFTGGYARTGMPAGLSLHVACTRDPDLWISHSFSRLRVAGTCSSPLRELQNRFGIICLSAIRDSRERGRSPVLPQHQI